MADQKKGSQSGKKAGSIIDDPIETQAQKGKPRKQKKQSKGKHKR